MIPDEMHLPHTDAAASPRLFRNPLLDRVSRVHPSVPLLIYLPAAAVLLWRARGELPLLSEVVAFGLGYVLWTLVEYFGHRLLFHIRPASATGQRIQFLIHGVHHQHPSDPWRLVMPPIMSIPIMTAAFAIWRLTLGPAIALPALAGFLVGYLIYDALHFYLHHAHPRTVIGRDLRRRHMHHHFRDDASWFGVSAPWWDAIFATRPAHIPDNG
jgi:dihydroceramide fatty acyl 2-hydroxylase